MFVFNLLPWALVPSCDYLTIWQTHHCVGIPSCFLFFHQHSPLSLSVLLLSVYPVHTLPHLLQHMPTHAAPQAHVIWNCIFPVLLSSVSLARIQPPLSVFHLSSRRSFTCIDVAACTLETRFSLERSWLPPALPSSSALLFVLMPCAVQIKRTFYCTNFEEACTVHFMLALWAIWKKQPMAFGLNVSENLKKIFKH